MYDLERVVYQLYSDSKIIIKLLHKLTEFRDFQGGKKIDTFKV